MLDKKFKANLNFGLATNISVLNVGHAVSGVWLKLYSCGGGGGLLGLWTQACPGTSLALARPLTLKTTGPPRAACKPGNLQQHASDTPFHRPHLAPPAPPHPTPPRRSRWSSTSPSATRRRWSTTG